LETLRLRGQVVNTLEVLKAEEALIVRFRRHARLDDPLTEKADNPPM
jgi:hypothetical protein